MQRLSREATAEVSLLGHGARIPNSLAVLGKVSWGWCDRHRCKGGGDVGLLRKGNQVEVEQPLMAVWSTTTGPLQKAALKHPEQGAALAEGQDLGVGEGALSPLTLA